MAGACIQSRASWQAERGNRTILLWGRAVLQSSNLPPLNTILMLSLPQPTCITVVHDQNSFELIWAKAQPANFYVRLAASATLYCIPIEELIQRCFKYQLGVKMKTLGIFRGTIVETRISFIAEHDHAVIWGGQWDLNQHQWLLCLLCLLYSQN
jgi:hypothetical protein